jgi:endonuclease/exonuclease/phosphatase family metal-dependent hydrolase
MWAPDNPRVIRVATYNVHKCRGLDLRTRPSRIVGVLRELDADVIGLQEIASVGLDQARFIAAALNFNLSFGHVRKYKEGPYGNAVLSRFAIRASSNHDITIQDREERGCLQVDLEISEKEVLHVFNVHMGTSYFERRRQAPRLVSEVLSGSHLRGPRIILGDFNEWTYGLTTRLLKAQFGASRRRLRKRSRSYPAILPLLRLDNIYHDRELILRRFSVHKSTAALFASDHLPLVADFAIRSDDVRTTEDLPAVNALAS